MGYEKYKSVASKRFLRTPLLCSLRL